MPVDREDDEDDYTRGVNDALDILEEYVNVPRSCWNRVLALVEDEE